MLLDDLEHVLDLGQFANPKEFIAQILTQPTSNVFEKQMNLVQNTFAEIQCAIQKNPLLARCISLEETGGMFIGSNLSAGFQIRSTIRINIDILKAIING